MRISLPLWVEGYSWIPLGGTLDPGRHRGYSWIPVGTVGTPGFSLAQCVILDPRRESRSTLLIIFDPFSAFVRSAFRVCSIVFSIHAIRVLLDPRRGFPSKLGVRGTAASNPICCGDSGGRAGCVTKPYKNYEVQILECELVLGSVQ